MLIFAGKVLDDDKTLKECNVLDGYCIQALIKVINRPLVNDHIHARDQVSFLIQQILQPRNQEAGHVQEDDEENNNPLLDEENPDPNDSTAWLRDIVLGLFVGYFFGVFGLI
mmetsp:Transcript_23453/g.26885  ORF Transcript_23453/g.26885 Transcript_23453/m.26885 type:complete len:112 (+) Transcript_23453:210-545(+)